MVKNGKKLDPGHMTPGQKIEYAVKVDADISQAQIKEWLIKDIRGVHILLSEILQTEECIDALVKVFYERYSTMHKAKTENPELNLNENGNV